MDFLGHQFLQKCDPQRNLETSAGDVNEVTDFIRTSTDFPYEYYNANVFPFFRPLCTLDLCRFSVFLSEIQFVILGLTKLLLIKLMVIPHFKHPVIQNI
jgi:hypothetical protein